VVFVVFVVGSSAALAFLFPWLDDQVNKPLHVEIKRRRKDD